MKCAIYWWQKKCNPSKLPEMKCDEKRCKCWKPLATLCELQTKCGQMVLSNRLSGELEMRNWNASMCDTNGQQIVAHTFVDRVWISSNEVNAICERCQFFSRIESENWITVSVDMFAYQPHIGITKRVHTLQRMRESMHKSRSSIQMQCRAILAIIMAISN